MFAILARFVPFGKGDRDRGKNLGRCDRKSPTGNQIPGLIQEVL
ncbi:hypothetical protein [Spirulina sp. 06S082]|nr:hypothetical protein [Spirulina sp. 06S082]MEA5469109.1 hypothetical protein [Spirulina sp. 06S082]